jgi:AcrR family transcriptional regulator
LLESCVIETKSKWQVKREASYEALVRSAMHCFYEKGYAATRVADIVNGTGYTSGTFYFHFANKTECFFHVIDHRERLRGDWTAFVPDLDPGTTPLEEVVDQALRVLASSLEGTGAWSVVMVDFFQQHRHDRAVVTRLRKVYARWLSEVEAFVTALQRGGWVDATRDPGVVTAEILAFDEGLTSHAVVFGLEGPDQHAARIEGLVRLLRPAHVGHRRSGRSSTARRVRTPSRPG